MLDGGCLRLPGRIRRMLWIMVLLLAAGAPLGAADPLTYHLIARDGGTAPNTGGGQYAGQESPSINDAGQVAYMSWLQIWTGDVDHDNNTAVFVATPTIDAEGHTVYTSDLWVRGDAWAPGTEPVVTFSTFGIPNMSDSGQIGFRGSLRGSPIAADKGFWAGTQGQLRLVARKGDPAPGRAAGTTFYYWQYTGWSTDPGPLINAQGAMGLRAVLKDDPDEPSNQGGGLWFDAPGGLEMVACEAGPDGIGTLCMSVGLNDSGAFAFRSQAAGGSTISAIWTNRGGTIEPVARWGDPAPGTALTFDFLCDPDINAAGQVAFSACRYGVWSEGGGTLHAVIAPGQTPPGAPAGSQFDNIHDTVISDAGHVAFLGFLENGGVTADDDSGIWAEIGGQLGLVAREGGPVPGTDGGVYFHRFDDPHINGRDQVAFWAELSGDDFTGTQTGLFATDPDGTLRCVARAGDMLPLESGGLSEIGWVYPLSVREPVGGGDGRPRCLNDDGWFVFRAGYLDGTTGTYVAIVPEPAGAWLLLCGGSLALRRRGGQK